MGFSATPGQLGLNEALLNPIITETETAIGEMNRLNNTINGIGEQIRYASQSDSGRIIYTKIGVWNQDYVKLRSALDELNTRVQGLRSALITAGSGASGSAGGSTL